MICLGELLPDSFAGMLARTTYCHRVTEVGLSLLPRTTSVLFRTLDSVFHILFRLGIYYLSDRLQALEEDLFVVYSENNSSSHAT